MEYTNVRYCDWDDIAAVLADDRNGVWHAWIHHNGDWKEYEAAEVSHRARLITEERFDQLFPGIGMPKELSRQGA